MQVAIEVLIRRRARGEECRECGYDRESGRHDSLEACSFILGHPCEKPEEHHEYRGRRWPILFSVRRIW